MKPLYQLVTQYRELQALEIEDIDEETLANTLEGLGGEITEKATNVSAFVRNMETFADSVEEAARAMQARAATIRKKADRTRAYLLNCMQGAGISKIQSPHFTIALRKNPPSVLIAESASIPEKYMVVPLPPPPRPDKKLIADALKAGEVIDGCQLHQSERLDIR